MSKARILGQVNTKYYGTPLKIGALKITANQPSTHRKNKSCQQLGERNTVRPFYSYTRTQAAVVATTSQRNTSALTFTPTHLIQYPLSRKTDVLDISPAAAQLES